MPKKEKKCTLEAGNGRGVIALIDSLAPDWEQDQVVVGGQNEEWLVKSRKQAVGLVPTWEKCCKGGRTLQVRKVRKRT